ncbi:hypothetical protein N7462_001753 [Penicillium macrosclerotiorum]|uniref:uncharacterized protein n=1 Tax=Penicillium macrosclerotiorum TaxID=303699 RepID=UPI002548C22E|nr:uncharacterized protein N7462_001753 [Penicillium macrosclerotiorum]KAJ5692330.1 hypothetical protein N7462_001753 [Penicillium macrosclerotiorum]
MSDMSRSTRHIKCDETPGVCNNCKSTGRKCDGYDISRLSGTVLPVDIIPNLGDQLGWVTTTDETRCFSYFTRCSIPGLATFFHLPLWQKLAMQMSRIDRAVYHAATMFGAIHEDSDHHRMRLLGENLGKSRHRFALEQASRAYSLLQNRSTSNDPQFREVLLLCCLLFLLSDLLLGRYDHAFIHLRGGLTIIEEAGDQYNFLTVHHEGSLQNCLVQIFQRLNFESALFGEGRPFLSFRNERKHDCLDACFPFTRQGQQYAHQSINNMLAMGVPFLTKCWLLSRSQVEADYQELFENQQRLISGYLRLKERIQRYYDHLYHEFDYVEKQGLEVLQLQCDGQLLSIKTCLLDGPIPDSFTPEYVKLLEACENFMSKFPERSTVTLDCGVVPSLYVVASKCPQYMIRLRAIDTLFSWPHVEGLINSNFVASLALKIMKGELQGKETRDTLSLIDQQAEKELDRFLSETLISTPQAINWPSIRAAKILSP